MPPEIPRPYPIIGRVENTVLDSNTLGWVPDSLPP
jgi:hypothetical protein